MAMYRMRNLSHQTFAFYTCSLSHFRAFTFSNVITCLPIRNSFRFSFIPTGLALQILPKGHDKLDCLTLLNSVRNARHTRDWPSKRSVEKTTTTAETALTTTSFRPTRPLPPRQDEPCSTSRGRCVQAVSGVLVAVARSLS